MPTTVAVIRMAKEHCRECATLHKNSITHGFLNEFGVRFLQALYEGVVQSEDCFGYVVMQDSHVAGFITGSVDMDGFFGRLIYKKFWVFTFSVGLRLLTKPSLIPKVIETFRYGRKSHVEATKAELVSVVVREECRGGGVGKMLFQELVNSFRARGVGLFKIMVAKDLVGANKFYPAIGCDLVSTFTLYDREFNLYTYKVPRQA